MKSEKESAVSPIVNYNDTLLARIGALEQKNDSMQINDRPGSKVRNRLRFISRNQSHSTKRFCPKDKS